MRLYIGNIPFTATDNALKDWFTAQGFQIQAIDLIHDPTTSQPRGFGFVEIPEEKAAMRAIQILNGKVFAGRPLTVNRAKPLRESR